MAKPRTVMIDGNEATASVAHRINDVCAIYPITPSSNMGEFADEWSARGQTNIWGTVPDVIEMQSEGGASAAVHGSLQAGALTTTFTASQGLLLMIPNMYKIAGELTSAVFHVSARTLATHALSIFGDHSDIKAVRQTGWGLLCLGLGAGGARHGLHRPDGHPRQSRIPFVHFFDGFRTSHEVSKIEYIEDDDLAAPDRRRAGPRPPRARPVAGHPVDPRHRAEPRHLLPGPRGHQPASTTPARSTSSTPWKPSASSAGRAYKLFDYVGDPEAERVIVIMGSGAEAVHEMVDWLNAQGEKVGVLKVRLYRPFSVKHFIEALPQTTKRIAVLDRTKEPGAIGEPLYMDVVHAARRGANSRASAPSPPIRWWSAAATACPRRSSTTPWSRRSSTTSPPTSRRTTSRSASSTTSPTLSLPMDDDFDIAARRRRPRRLLRSRRRRHRGRQQELDQDHRRGDRQLRPGLLRLRLEEGRRGHRLPPALRTRDRSAPPT